MIAVGCAALIAVGGGVTLNQTHALDALELKLIDARFAVRGAREPDKAIVIVGIDSQTFSQLQLQWPFHRDIHARLIERLKRDRARAIVYDVQFTEPSTPTNGSEAARRAAVERDNALITAVHRAGNVALATSEVWRRGANQIFGGGGILGRIGARAGAAILPPDADGVDRRMIFSYRGLRTLGIVAAEIASGRAMEAGALGGDSALIDFAGPAGSVPEISFANVLQNKVPASKLAGKIVVIGPTASSLQDVHPTPMGSSGLMSGPEIIANEIATARAGFPLQLRGGYITLLLIVAFGMLAPLAGLRLAPGWVITCSLGVGAAYAFVAQWAFQQGAIMPMVCPLGALILGCAGAVAADTFGERRRLQLLNNELALSRNEGAQYFISYRRLESPFFIDSFYAAFVKRNGAADIFMDRKAIEPGSIWPEEIEMASARCRAMLVVIGPGWVNARNSDGTRCLDDPDDWVRREVAKGLERVDCTVVPVLYDTTTMPSRKDLPDALKDLIECEATIVTSEDLDSAIKHIIRSVHRGRIRRIGRRQLLTPSAQA